MFQYLVYDVFTQQPFGGNQLAVFPDASDIPEERLQAIAAEFNYSEVTFVYPPENERYTAKVRIFTPLNEIDFAGHPTIGTAKALSDLGYPTEMVLELGVGPLPCTVSKSHVAFTTSVPLDIIGHVPIEFTAKALGLKPEKIKADIHKPSQASLGLPFVFVELLDDDALSVCDPHVETIREGAKLYPTGLDFALFVYTRQDNKVKARMFAPLDNIPEDPATGSACATLGAMLSYHLKQNLSLDIMQGVDMGRPSHILVDAQRNPQAVTVKGQAVKVMEGHFILPKN